MFIVSATRYISARRDANALHRRAGSIVHKLIDTVFHAHVRMHEAAPLKSDTKSGTNVLFDDIATFSNWINEKRTGKLPAEL